MAAPDGRRGRRRAAAAGAALLAAAAALACAGDPGGAGRPARSAHEAISHELLDGLLARHVENGLVDYLALKSDPDLPAYLEGLAAADPTALPSRAERLAYWINAYNAFTLKGVVDRYPIRSIRDVPPLGRLTFFRALKFRAGRKDLTLDTIEHTILRAQLRETRIHFAIVCASLGCPRLGTRAFHAETLDADLEAAARAFIRDPAKVRLERRENVLYLSPVFDWFGEDFERAKGSVVAYLRAYLPAPDAEFLVHRKVAIRWLDYDWTLNDRALAPATGAPAGAGTTGGDGPPPGGSAVPAP